MSPTIIDQDNDALIEITEEEVKIIFPEFKFSKPLPKKISKGGNGEDMLKAFLENIPFPDLERTSYEKTFVPNFEL